MRLTAHTGQAPFNASGSKGEIAPPVSGFCGIHRTLWVLSTCPCTPSPCHRHYPEHLSTMVALPPCGRVDGGRGPIASPFPSVPLRTVRDRFRVTRLSGSCIPPVQQMHITCASPWEAVYLDCFALYVAFPCALVRHDSHDYYQSSVAIGSHP